MTKEKLDILRHSAAHLTAAACQELYPDAKFGIGPVIENGFYYDIEFSQNISEDDLAKIEKRVKELINRGILFKKKDLPIDEAIKFFKKEHQPYKVELLEDLKMRGTTKMNAEEIDGVGGSVENVSLYTSGNFVDLCRGPHVESAKELNPDGLKLVRLAGAYWRGKNENPQLQRLYGVYFPTNAELEEYLNMLSEAEKRDHRKIGAEQDLFFIDDSVGKGLIMWLPNGVIIRDEIEKLAITVEREAGYVRVITPHLAKEELFLTCGHLPYYKDSMYPGMTLDDGVYYLKPMSCPFHNLIYRHKIRSYRELPLRLAEYGTVYRNELSGTLAGLLRVRGFTQNDAHIYCRKDQIKDEFKKVIKLTMRYFEIFGLKKYWFRLSKWGPEHLEKYINEPENWEYSQGVIREVLQEMNVNFVEADDEAAFYGPKVDVQFKSIVGREETLSTIQLDFAIKTRFKLNYIDESGKENNEVFVIHRAPLGSHERFLGFLIEHYGGVWPLWLSPIQVAVAPVSEKHIEGAKKLVEEFVFQGLRVFVDESNETVGNKVRKAITQKIPYILVVGDKELAGEDLTLRVRGQDEQIKVAKGDFLRRALLEVKGHLNGQPS